MGRFSPRLILLPILIVSILSGSAHALLCLAGERRTSLKEEMRFGVEAAEHGLWREAIFRWEKFLKDHPESARLRNNLAVAYESLGQFDKAEEQYKKAGDLEPNNKDIKDNYASFQEIYKAVRQRQAPSVPAPTPGAALPQTSKTPDASGTPAEIGAPAGTGAPADSGAPAGGR